MKKYFVFIHDAFLTSVVLKGIDSILEIMGGILLWAVPKQALSSLAVFLTQHELAEDPRDVIAGAVRHAVTGLSVSAKVFGAIYLLSHGIVKIVLVIALLQRRLWAYPTMIVFLILFSVYQVYRYAYGGQVSMLLLTAFDLLVAWLTWREWKRMHAKGIGSADAAAA